MKANYLTTVLLSSVHPFMFSLPSLPLSLSLPLRLSVQLASRHRNSGSGGDEMEKTIVAGTSNGRLSPSAALEGMR